MNWLSKLLPSRVNAEKNRRRSIPEGLWTKCLHCGAVLYRPELKNNLWVCPKCAFHMRIAANTRMEVLLDAEPAPRAIGPQITPQDSLKFKDLKRYKDRLQDARKKSNLDEALLVREGQLQNIPVVACCFEFKFLGGSMGSVVGERFVLAVQAAIEREAALLCCCSSGGARMQEALLSLMQMSKTAAALALLRRRGLPYLSVLCDPTTGGVSASVAALGDVILAEPGALIGFAGPRVIEKTVLEKLPEGFQRSESLFRQGGVDLIVDRRELREYLGKLLALLTRRSGTVPPVTNPAPDS